MVDECGGQMMIWERNLRTRRIVGGGRAGKLRCETRGCSGAGARRCGLMTVDGQSRACRDGLLPFVGSHKSFSGSTWDL